VTMLKALLLGGVKVGQALLLVAFLVGLLAGVTLSLAGHHVMAFIARRTGPDREAWTASIIGALLNGQTSMAKLRILQSVMDKDMDEGEAKHRADVLPFTNDQGQWN